MISGKNIIFATEKGAKKQSFFYGWVVAVACFAMVFVSIGLGNSTNGLFITPVTEELGFSRGVYSIVFSFRFISTATLNIFFYFFFRKLEAKKIIGVGFGLLSIAYFIFSKAQNLWVFYICGILYGAGLAFSSTAVVSVLIERWFIEHKGTIMGIVLAGSGLGGSFFNIIASGWIRNFGWRQAYLFIAICLAICSIPIIVFVRNTPNEMGLTPLGSRKKNLDDAKKVRWGGFTFSECLRKPYFYVMALCVFFIGFLNSPVYVAAPSHMIDRGLDAQFAATAMSIFFFCLAIAKVSMGFAYDRFGLKLTLMICFTSNILGVLILALTHNKLTAILFAVIFSFSVSMETLTIPLMIFEVFGSKSYGSIIGVFLAMCTIGVAVGNPIMNFSYDISGSYQGILLLYLAISLIVLVLLLYTMKSARKDQEYCMASTQKI